MYRTGSFRREIGMRSGRYTGGAVLIPWRAIDVETRRKLIAAKPIVAESQRAKTTVLFALAGACFLALVIVSGTGFGRVDGAWLVQGPAFAIAYAALLAGTLVFGLALARRVLSATSWLPWRRAVLALDAVEADPRGLVVRPFGDARYVVAHGGAVELQYADGSTFRIVATNIAWVEANIALAETTLQRASLGDDDAFRTDTDPLASLRDEKGFTPRAHAARLDAHTKRRRRNADVVVTIALVAFAAAVAMPLLAHRNHLSDDAAFAFASQRGFADDYEGYLAHGGARHATEVRARGFPHALLDQAITDEQLAAYTASYPRSPYRHEAQSRLMTYCDEIARPYFERSFANVSEVLAAYDADHPACVDETSYVRARLYRDADTWVTTVASDPLRPVLHDMVAQARDTGRPVWIDMIGDMGDAVTELRTNLHGVIEPAVERVLPPRSSVALVATWAPPVCNPGEIPDVDAQTIDVALWMDGSPRNRWVATVSSHARIARVILSGWTVSSGCVKKP